MIIRHYKPTVEYELVPAFPPMTSMDSPAPYKITTSIPSKLLANRGWWPFTWGPEGRNFNSVMVGVSRHHITLDLGVPTPIVKVSAYASFGDSGSFYSTYAEVAVCNDNTNWETIGIDPVIHNNWWAPPASVEIEKDFNSALVYRYWRAWLGDGITNRVFTGLDYLRLWKAVRAV